MSGSASGSNRTPASDVYVVKTKVLPQSYFGYFLRWSFAWLLFLRTLFKPFGPWVEPIGPKVRVQIRERGAGRVVHERTLRRDGEQLGPTIRRLVEDVHRLDFPSFLNKYAIPPR